MPRCQKINQTTAKRCQRRSDKRSKYCWQHQSRKTRNQTGGDKQKRILCSLTRGNITCWQDNNPQIKYYCRDPARIALDCEQLGEDNYSCGFTDGLECRIVSPEQTNRILRADYLAICFNQRNQREGRIKIQNLDLNWNDPNLDRTIFLDTGRQDDDFGGLLKLDWKLDWFSLVDRNKQFQNIYFITCPGVHVYFTANRRLNIRLFERLYTYLRPNGQIFMYPHGSQLATQMGLPDLVTAIDMIMGDLFTAEERPLLNSTRPGTQVVLTKKP